MMRSRTKADMSDIMFDPTRLIELRRQKNLSQNALAALAHVSVGWVQKAERGEFQRPSLEYLGRIAAALSVQLWELMPDGMDPGAPSQLDGDDDLLDELIR